MDKKETTEEVSYELNVELIQKIAKKLEDTLDDFFLEEAYSPLELITVLMTLSSEIAVDTGIMKGDFMDLASQFHSESELFSQEEVCESCQVEDETDISKLN